MSRVLLLALVAGTLLATPVLAETIAITGAKIETAGPAGEIASGTVVIKDGKIVAVGANVAPPAGARVIDARGKVVTPGLIAASSDLGLVEVGGVQATRDASAGSEIGAAFDVSYGINPSSILFPVARQTGVTRAISTPSGSRGGGGEDDEVDASDFKAGSGADRSAAASLFLGQAAGVTTAASTDVVFKPKIAMVVDLGDAGARVAGSRGAAVVLLKSALESARHYAANRAAYDRTSTRDDKISRDDLEALIPVVEGREPLLIRVHRASDIRLALRLAREEKLKIVLEGAEEGWIVAADLAAAGVPVLIDAEADLPEQFESLGSRLDNAARLQAAGVIIGILGSHEFQNLREARFNAGTAVANGLPYAEAIKSVTSNVARIWGLDQTGSLEAGKAADVVIWSGDPLETSSYPLALFVDGREQPMTSRGLELRDRYATTPSDGYPRAYH